MARTKEKNALRSFLIIGAALITAAIGIYYFIIQSGADDATAKSASESTSPQPRSTVTPDARTDSRPSSRTASGDANAAATAPSLPGIGQCFDSGSFTVKVTNTKGEPLENCNVALIDEGDFAKVLRKILKLKDDESARFTATTDAGGIATFADVPCDDSYALEVSRDGYAPEASWYFYIWPKPTINHRDVVLGTGCTLDGFVYVAPSRGVPNATMKLNSGRFERISKSDATGHFRIPDLPPGPIRFSLSAPGFLDCYNGSGKGEIENGATWKLEFEMYEARTVRGHVKDDHSNAIAGAFLYFSALHGTDDFNVTNSATTDSAGMFTIQLPVGLSEASVQVTKSGFSTFNEDHCDVRSDPLVYQLSRASLLPVSVMDAETRAPVAPTHISVGRYNPDLQITEFEHGVNVREQRDGARSNQYNIPLLSSGIYIITIEALGFTTHKSERIDFNVEAEGTPLEIHMERAVGISGTLVDAATRAPIANAYIELRPRLSDYEYVMKIHFGIPVRDDLREAAKTVFTDSFGVFTIPDVAPGTYVVRARKPLTTMLAQTAPFTFDAKKNMDLGQIAVEHSASVFGTVIGTDGKPASDIPIITFRADGFLIMIKSAAAGEYSIPALPAGNYHIEAGDAYGVPSERAFGASADPVSAADSIYTFDLKIDPGARVRYDLDLRDRVGSVSGTVKINHIPYAGGRVVLSRSDDLGGIGEVGKQRDAVVNPDGSILFERVPAGRYQFNLTCKANGTVLYQIDVEVRGRAAETVDIDLPLAKIQGVVSTGAPKKPFPGAICLLYQVTATSNSGNLGELRVAADDQGQFNFSEIPPGKYKLYVYNPGFAWKTFDITTTESPETKQFDIVLDEPESPVTVRFSPEPENLEGISLQVFDSKGKSIRHDQLYQDESKAILLNGLGEGDYKIQIDVDAKDRKFGSLIIHLSAGKAAIATIELK
ncbi:MAG: carboxypeptidase regulatory-like domain-containing protein [Planctomycetes bacterium]|nr:carboxypeptidase regulatory-like domain-containing protein [Planctomycetota bacterium]